MNNTSLQSLSIIRACTTPEGHSFSGIFFSLSFKIGFSLYEVNFQVLASTSLQRMVSFYFLNFQVSSAEDKSSVWYFPRRFEQEPGQSA